MFYNVRKAENLVKKTIANAHIRAFICYKHVKKNSTVPLLTLQADNIRNAVFAASDGSFLER